MIVFFFGKSDRFFWGEKSDFFLGEQDGKIIVFLGGVKKCSFSWVKRKVILFFFWMSVRFVLFSGRVIVVFCCLFFFLGRVIFLFFWKSDFYFDFLEE